MNELPSIKELKNMEIGEGHCSYTKHLQDISSIYVLNNVIIKNRGDSYNLKNIIIEKDRMVDIYCEKEKAAEYEKIIEKVKKYGKSYITIHIV